ncbi:MAG TPA: hypothetical protein VGX23_33625 [Actinocrinis sp.]|nr:hypothetical protein [Actinocrinis sp.]
MSTARVVSNNNGTAHAASPNTGRAASMTESKLSPNATAPMGTSSAPM